jgi:hypothetical protein
MSSGDLTKPGLLHDPDGAVISDCGNYRYWLHRSWMLGKGWTVFVMLNPSTADADIDDSTVRRCVRYAQSLGTRGLIVVNLFAWRATNPNALAKQDDPIGPENHAYITRACELAAQHEEDTNNKMYIPGKVICAWGAHPFASREHIETVMGWIDVAYGQASCLGRTKSGAPKHPLYTPKGTQLEAFP